MDVIFFGFLIHLRHGILVDIEAKQVLLIN